MPPKKTIGPTCIHIVIFIICILNIYYIKNLNVPFVILVYSKVFLKLKPVVKCFVSVSLLETS